MKYRTFIALASCNTEKMNRMALLTEVAHGEHNALTVRVTAATHSVPYVRACWH